jgi:hypothetical protein
MAHGLVCRGGRINGEVFFHYSILRFAPRVLGVFKDLVSSDSEPSISRYLAADDFTELMPQKIF